MRRSPIAARMLGAIGVCAIAALAPAIARAGSADDLADARRLKATLDWAHALAAADRALADGDADPARVIELHQLAGELAAGLDDDDLAVAHFEQMLALAPAATLPAGTSPKIVARFDAARARAVGRAAFAAHAVTDDAGLVVVIDADPLAMAMGARARFRDATAAAPRDVVVRGVGRIALAVPPGATAIELAVVDAHGNALWTGAPPAPTHTAHARARSWAGTTVWSAAAAASLAVGAISVWRYRTAQDEWNALRADDGNHDYSELAAVETRGQRWAIAADVAFGAAIATGAVAAILAVRELRADDGAPARGVTIAPLVTPAALGVAIDAHF